MARDGSNVVTSPLSTATLLAVAAAGAEGDTADELVTALGLDGRRDPRFAALLTSLSTSADAEVTIANAAGTEASAVTVMDMDESMPPSYRFDRPFALTIRDEATGTLLFVGTIADPAA